MSAAVEVLTPAELAIGIMEGYRGFIEREERRTKQESRQAVYASSWRACTRQMALELVAPGALPDFEASTLANFRRGKDRERNLRADLMNAGRDSTPSFEVVGMEERFTLRDHKGRIVIAGKVDAQIQIGRKRFPLEIKSWHPNLVAKIRTFEDLFDNRWTRSGAHQLLAYLLAMAVPVGFMLLDRNGLPLLLEVELERHLDRIEDFLHRAEIAMDAAEAFKRIAKDRETPEGASAPSAFEALPAFHDDPSECRKCGFFGSVCNPPISHDGAKIVTDEETLIALETREALKDSHRAYEAADEQVKERFRGIPQAIAGPFLVTGKPRKTTKTVFPDEATKKLYQKSDPEGAWIVTVTQVGEAEL